MERLLLITLSNVLLATAMAAVLLPLARMLRKPALSHAACLLVLLKLLMPPLWNVPVVPLHRTIDVPATVQHAVVEEQAPALTDISEPQNWDDFAWGMIEERGRSEVSLTAPSVAVEAPQGTEGPDRRHPLAVPILSVWAAGSILCIAVIMGRILRLRAMLRSAALAPLDVQHRKSSLASRLGLSGGSPSVWFACGGVCPMLLGLWRRPRLIVPHPLWAKLDEEQRDTLLLHELAHYRRGDHHVRWIELVATVLYWWNPLLWWVRRELRSAEEQCCDAWVTWALPHAARAYLNALLDVIDFAAARRPRPVGAAALGSGMGQFSELKRRFVMIQEGRVHRSLSWGGLAAVVGIGALLLPVTLAAAQQQDPPAVNTTSVIDSSNVGTVGANTDAGATPQEESAAPVTAATPSDDPKLRQELRRARAEVQQLAAQLATAQARLAKLEATVSGSYGSSQTVGVDPTTGRAGDRAPQGGGAANNYARPMTAPGNPTATTSESAWGSGGYGSSSADAYSRATRGYADAADFRLRSNRTSSSAAGQPTQRAVADQVNVTALLKAVQDLQATVSQLQRDVQALRQGGTERQGAIEPLPRP